MALLFGEAGDFGFDGGAVTGAEGGYLAGVERRAVEVGADDVVCARVGVGNVAGDLQLGDAVG